MAVFICASMVTKYTLCSEKTPTHIFVHISVGGVSI